jgi:hypothetical protein
MPIFATLAKAKFDIKSTKRSNLVVVRQRIDQLSDSGYILGQYMTIKHNLLYKNWTASLRG